MRQGLFTLSLGPSTTSHLDNYIYILLFENIYFWPNEELIYL